MSFVPNVCPDRRIGRGRPTWIIGLGGRIATRPSDGFSGASPLAFDGLGGGGGGRIAGADIQFLVAHSCECS